VETRRLIVEVISYDRALEIAKSVRDGTYTDKVIGVFFTLKDCDICGPWLKDTITPVAEQLKDDFQAYAVYVDDNDIAFPPTSTPTSYFFVPGKDNRLQINRSGPGPMPAVLDDVGKMIIMKNENKTLYEVFYG
jgi:hypothetical protein